MEKLGDVIMFMFFMSMFGMSLAVPILFISLAYDVAKNLF